MTTARRSPRHINLLQRENIPVIEPKNVQCYILHHKYCVTHNNKLHRENVGFAVETISVNLTCIL